MPGSGQQKEDARKGARDGQGGPNEPRPASRAGQAIIIMSAVVSAAVLTVALDVLQGIFRPFFIAIFLCFLVKPWTAKLGRRTGMLGYALAIAIIFGIFSVGDRIVRFELQELPANSRGYQERLESYREGMAAFLDKNETLVEVIVPDSEVSGVVEDRPAADDPDREAWEREHTSKVHAAKVARALEMIMPVNKIDDILDPKLLSRILGSSASFVFGFFGEALVILICMLLILLETDRLPARLRRVYGEERAERVLAVVADVNKSVQRYVSLKVLISFITAFVSVVIMKVSGLHYAATFGIIVFLFNFVPYIGSVIATILPCLVGLLQFKEPLSALWLAIALAVAQQIIGNVIEPRVQGKGLSISPVVIILALGFWGWLWGISGMILAVPITVTIRIILEQFETTRRPALMMGSDG
ncbi:MAG: AI-2E family transporter [Planctomycetes bacterium]|nr:AI-2E family transporter [Planctomycetota bacterium]